MAELEPIASSIEEHSVLFSGQQFETLSFVPIRRYFEILSLFKDTVTVYAYTNSTKFHKPPIETPACIFITDGQILPQRANLDILNIRQASFLSWACPDLPAEFHLQTALSRIQLKNLIKSVDRRRGKKCSGPNPSVISLQHVAEKSGVDYRQHTLLGSSSLPIRI